MSILTAAMEFIMGAHHAPDVVGAHADHEENHAAGHEDGEQITDEVLHEIERNEGDRLTAYRDVVGVWTIGYGHTGADVHEGLVITQAQAEALLWQDLRRFEDDIEDDISGHPATDNQFSAMVSLSYNIGSGNFRKSTVLRKFLAGDMQGAADAFRMWNKAGGQVYAGLARRREEERAVFLKPDDA